MSLPKKTRLDQLQKKTSVVLTGNATLSELRDGDRQLVGLSAAAGQAITLPSATGKGGTYRLFVQTSITSNTTTITASGTDKVKGVASLSGSTSGTFGTSSGTTITMNGSTQGGLAGSYVELEDAAPGVWRAHVVGVGSGTTATPFS